MRFIRFAVRAKVAQLMGAGGVAVGLAGVGAADLSLADALVLAGIVSGSVGGSLSLWCGRAPRARPARAPGRAPLDPRGCLCALAGRSRPAAPAQNAAPLARVRRPDDAPGAPARALDAGRRYYGRRYVGELSLLEPARDVLRFSVLDVWGNREDVDVPLARVTPPFRGMAPKAVEHVCNQLLFPVDADVPGEGRRQFYVSVVAGQLLQGRVFMDLLAGRYAPPGPAAGGAAGAEAAAAAAEAEEETSAVEQRDGAAADVGASKQV
jgi:hypothetical protein